MDKTKTQTLPTEHKGLSDEAVDGIAAIVLIAVTVSAVVFWLSLMPN